jgi:hypothetical protein
VHAASVKGSAGRPPDNAYVGVVFDAQTNKYSLSMSAPTSTAASDVGPDKTFVLHFEGADECARAYDCIQLLLYGPFATTNFPYASYTPACLRAAAEKLHLAGCHLEAAIAAAQRAVGPCAWVRICPGAAPGQWMAQPVELVVRGRVVRFEIGPFADPDSAAGAADAAVLVLEGPVESRHGLRNFPMASYSEAVVRAAQGALVAWMASEQLFGGAYGQQAVKLLLAFEENIKMVNRVGARGLAVGAGGLLSCMLGPIVKDNVLGGLSVACIGHLCTDVVLGTRTLGSANSPTSWCFYGKFGRSDVCCCTGT